MFARSMSSLLEYYFDGIELTWWICIFIIVASFLMIYVIG